MAYKPHEKIAISGIEYESTEDACKALGIRKSDLLKEVSKSSSSDTHRAQRKTRAIEINGQKFPSAKAACEHFDINLSSYRARIKNGMTPEEALLSPTRKYEKSDIVVQDKLYSSVTELCKAYGLRPATYAARIKRGMTPEEAVMTAASSEKKPRPITIGKVTYDSLISAAIAFDKNPTTLKRRLANGWTPEQAVGLDPGKFDEPITVDDHTFASINEIAEYYDISPFAIRWDITNGLTVLESIRTRGRAKLGSIPVVYKGVPYPSISAAATAVGLPASAVNRRLDSGWTLEDALSRPLTDTGSSQSVEVEGTTYSSIAEAALQYGVPLSVVYKRKSRGWSIERALLTPARQNLKRIPQVTNSPLTPEEKTTEIVPILTKFIKDSPQCLAYVQSKGSSDEFINDIRARGIQEPLMVRQISSNAYELLHGYKRKQAAIMLGLETVPCKVVEASDMEALKIMQSTRLSHLKEAKEQ